MAGLHLRSSSCVSSGGQLLGMYSVMAVMNAEAHGCCHVCERLRNPRGLRSAEVPPVCKEAAAGTVRFGESAKHVKGTSSAFLEGAIPSIHQAAKPWWYFKNSLNRTEPSLHRCRRGSKVQVVTGEYH